MTPIRAPSAARQGAAYSLITMGCPKNEADSDTLAARLALAGHGPVEPGDAEVLIVNTCGFIDAAKEESIDVILEASTVARRTGARLVVVGCLVSLHRSELEAEIPEVDLYLAFDDAPLFALLDQVAASAADTSPYRDGARVRRPLHAFVKVSDGCDRSCSFCAIPLIKGRHEVVAPRAVLAAAERALEAGAREVCLVGQDTSRWSFPGYGGLPRLLADLAKLGPSWLRLLYLQPDGVDDALMEAVALYAVPYFDLPLQHADSGVLTSMGRGGDAHAFLALLERLRERVPGAAVRSTFLVGHPGETQAAFDDLVAFVRAAAIALAGVFVFDPQPGTAAAAMAGRVPIAVAERRAARLTDEIEHAARPFWRDLIGRPLDMLVEKGTRESEREAIGRICYQAPDVDGLTYATGRPTRRGALVRVRPTDVTGFDVHAVAEPAPTSDRCRRDTS